MMDKLLSCSFCGKSQHEVPQLIAGPSAFICNECVELCVDIIAEMKKPVGQDSLDLLPPPLDEDDRRFCSPR